MDVIESIDFSETNCAVSTVNIQKPTGAIRMCGNFKPLNANLLVDQYPLPRPADLFNALRGGKLFCKIDLRDAYLQIEMSEESWKFLVINTHKGLFQYKRLPFGIASSPAIFQRIMDQVLAGLIGVVCYLDDIMLGGRDAAEVLQWLEEVFSHLQKFGLHIRLDKCVFFEKSVEYLGHVINAEGLHPSPKKVEAILKAHPPTNVAELHSFLGMVQYHSEFFPMLVNYTANLYRLLKKDVEWFWDDAANLAFNKIKEQITSLTFWFLMTLIHLSVWLVMLVKKVLVLRFFIVSLMELRNRFRLLLKLCLL